MEIKCVSCLTRLPTPNMLFARGMLSYNFTHCIMDWGTLVHSSDPQISCTLGHNPTLCQTTSTFLKPSSCIVQWPKLVINQPKIGRYVAHNGNTDQTATCDCSVNIAYFQIQSGTLCVVHVVRCCKQIQHPPNSFEMVIPITCSFSSNEHFNSIYILQIFFTLDVASGPESIPANITVLFCNNQVPLLRNETSTINWMKKHIIEKQTYNWILITVFSLNSFPSSSFLCILQYCHNAFKPFFRQQIRIRI